MNVVLADGRAVTVSKNKNKDLWWAMRGAGHNFGIVTSFNAKIWPAVIKSYFYRTYTFKGDKLEPLFRTLNTFHNNGTTPTEWLGAWGVFTMDRTVDKNKVCWSVMGW
jgi:FAD/FMN-containing dehydrogenase